MIDKNLIKNFETISNFDNFSKYSSVLDKKFRDKTLKDFVISLKHYRPKERENFIEELHKKFPYQHEEKEIIINNDSFFENILRNKLRNGTERKSANDKHLTLNDSFKIIKGNDSPDPWKYNPNYDSIYKNIPSFKMVYDNHEDKTNVKSKINKLIKSKIDEDNKLKDNSNDNKIKLDKKKYNLFKTNIKINKMKNKYINKKNIFLNLPKVILKSNNNTKEENYNYKKYNTLEAKNKKQINLSEFNKYKYNKKHIRDENQKNIKLSNVLNYKKNIINNKFVNFGKMTSRNDKYLINSYSLDIPSLDKYSPKYSYIEDSVKNIKFTPFGLNKNNKKFLLKKMMNSYNVPTEYQFIDNKRLPNDDELIKKQLILNHNIYQFE